MSIIKRNPYMLKRKRVLSLFQLARNKSESPIYKTNSNKVVVMACPTHEFMGSSQFIIVFFDAEILGEKGGVLAKSWRNGKHEDRHNKSNVPTTEGVNPQRQKNSAWVLEMKPWHTDRGASHKKASGERECEVCK